MRPRSRRVLLAAGLLAVGGLLGAACSSDDRVGDAEEGIAAVLADRLERSPDAVAVVCPDDAELDAGTTVSCDVTVDGGSPQPVALDIGDGGEAQLATAVIPTPAVEEYLAGQLAAAAEGEVTVDCGDEPLVVHPVGESFTCQAVRTSDGASFIVTVDVVGLDGTVQYHVVASTTTTTAPTTTAVPPP